MISRRTATTLVVLAFTSTPLLAQGQFGRSVAVGNNGEVFVLKPTPAQGPAAVFVFDEIGSTGEWSLSQELHGAGAIDRGHGLSISLASIRGALFAASGDPQVEFGAHVFRADGGGWMPDGRIVLQPGAPPAEQKAQLDLQGLMRIMQPAQRVIAAEGNSVVVGVVNGLPAKNGVRVFTRNGASWSEGFELRVPGLADNARFGSAVAAKGSHIAVGAPRHGGGMVFVFVAADNGWSLMDSLTVADLALNAGFGTALTFQGEAIVASTAGGSGLGSVVRFELSTQGWRAAATLTGAEAGPGSGFGAALGVDGEALFVGAPMADEGRGLVFHYTWRNGSWMFESALGSGLPDERAQFGASVAAGAGRLIAGAPAAAGGDGRAVVRIRADSGWNDPVVLSPGSALEMVTGQEVVCERGEAAGFDCSNVDLLAYLPLEMLGAEPGERVSDTWGWTDPMTGREFALVGRTGGAVFIDITDPTSPVRIGELPANPSGARDLKVYQDHLFFTGDGAGEHGLIVFDLSRLRQVTSPPVVFEADAVYDGIASAHNLIINTESGFAFPVGATGGGETCGGGLHMVDIRDPVNPSFAGCYTDTEGLIWAGRTHDGQCVEYHGPDQTFRGRQLCFVSNETALRIVDVTDKANPVPISAASYPGIAYAHQGWLTDDQRYFYLNDELDELIGTVERTRTLVWDVAELDDPVMIGEFFGPNGATDHNLFVRGNRMYQANYQAGLRVIDISDPENPVEIGFFDTTPYEGNPPGFSGGAWTAFPFFESGTVIVSSMNEGLFILRPRPSALIP